MYNARANTDVFGFLTSGPIILTPFSPTINKWSIDREGTSVFHFCVTCYVKLTFTINIYYKHLLLTLH